MNLIWSRTLKAAYRREPVLSFLMIVGGVHVVIGGLGQHVSLLLFGLSAIGAAIALHWWQAQRNKMQQPEPVVPKYSLPPRSSRHLPLLSIAQHRTKLLDKRLLAVDLTFC